MARIRKSDQVIVLTGKDTGKRGTVLRVLDDGHLLIEGVNRVKKHQKPNPMRQYAGWNYRKRGCRFRLLMSHCLMWALRRRIVLVQGAGGRPPSACVQVQWRNGLTHR